MGCSGSFPGPDSPASCYLVEADGFRLVLDLGNGALGALQRYSGLGEIDAICLSHLHADHCLDMCGYSVFQNYHPDGPRPPIPVYGPAGTRGAAHRRARRRPPRHGRRLRLRHAGAGHDRDRPAAGDHRAHESPGRDVRFPARARRSGAGLLGRHRTVRATRQPGRRRRRAALRGVVHRRPRPARRPAPHRPPGSRARGAGRRSASWC